MLKPIDEYPSQTVLAAGYPYGKARNQSIPGDNTGTPLEAAWISDWWGFQAALVAAAGIEPSGSPDKVGACQLLEAIEALEPLRKGGVVTLKSTVTIREEAGGSSKDVVIEADFICLKTAFFAQPITVSDNATFTAAVSVGGQLSCDNLESAGPIQGASLDIDNDADIAGTLTAGTSRADTFVQQTSSPSTFTRVNMDGVFALTGSGRIRRRHAELTDADGEMRVSVADLYWSKASLGANRTITLLNTGAVNGDRLMFKFADGGDPNGFNYQFRREDASLIGIASLATEWEEFEFIDGQWERLRSGT